MEKKKTNSAAILITEPQSESAFSVKGLGIECVLCVSRMQAVLLLRLSDSRHGSVCRSSKHQAELWQPCGAGPTLIPF